MRQELAEKSVAADRDQHGPGHVRAPHEQARQCAMASAAPSSRRRQFVEREPARHEAKTQITATRMARLISAGFTALALLAGFRFAQQIGAVQRRVIIGRDQREAASVSIRSITQPKVDIRRAYGHHAVAVEIVF